ncbi:MAG: DnaD domain protein [Eubacteriales bacterium]|nr:DnaD domain protein [Eubacteriales bacterium]
MNPLKFTNNIQSGITVISNEFIDQYMGKADGEFVKIYLLMLRLMNQGSYKGPEQLADVLDLTQKDVLRALKYWEKEGLLTSSSSELERTAEEKTSTKETMEAINPDIAITVPAVPDKIEITPKELSNSIDQTDLGQIIYMAEAYIGRPLSHKELISFYYMENQLHFPQDLLEYLVEYCVTKGKKSVRYMESVAINWYQQRIDTVKKAKEQSAAYTQNVFPVMKAFGISGRNPAPSELEFINKWNEMGFDTSILEEACNRTMLSTHQASFPYANRILEEWKKQGVRTLDDIHALDQNFHASKPANGNGIPDPKKASNNAFHNFEQRSYDYDDLEARLHNLS